MIIDYLHTDNTEGHGLGSAGGLCCCQELSGRDQEWLLGRGYYFDASCGDVGGGDEAYALEFDDDALLACSSGYASFYSLKLACGDSDDVATLVVDVAGIDYADVTAFCRGGYDEALHASVGHDEGRVVAGASVTEVGVVVVDEGAYSRLFHDVGKGQRCGMCEYEAGEEWQLYTAAFAFDHFVGAAEWIVCCYVISF